MPPGSGRRRRALGQHFLRDAGIARAIVDLIAPTLRDLVVEIGAGEGALTGELARRAGSVVALEIDPVLAARLRERFPDVDVREVDARSWNYGAVRRPPGGRVLVAGNLPYSVSKPILMALIAARTGIDEMVLMLQREVAERVAAVPGSKTYGSLSVLSQVACDVRIALRVPPGAFRPPPRVESAVLRVSVRAAPRFELPDEERFRLVVRAAFAQRRKTLANALSAGLAISHERARALAAGAGIDLQRRAETLTIEEFAVLTRALGRRGPSGQARSLGPETRECS